ncbi:hypothetical protein FB567DRAFT_590325 [Paraphoma chrysanthemicola]|uniref:RGS domain-containing protein n=1 Tax=Paraphoma chrysanthemicola TaxID=798071 RepID=A0A8K0W148_9PLEO|nr:hypothetical protein FB567DRAFT_590325 [Paraphoma chrysanthemicola]
MNAPGLTIYNLPPMRPNWDRVGVFYVTFCAIWTTIIMLGMAFCWYNRTLPILRVRGLPLAFGSVIFLHLYWIMAQITYPIGATMPIVIAYDVQYFVMGTWFPLGIALFHASNLRFFYVARLQKQFAQPGFQRSRNQTVSTSSWLGRLRNMTYTSKVMTFIIAGMVVQTLLTVGMWLVCKKYHPGFGIPGTEIKGATLPEQLIDLGRGWEWWPSVVWQFIWTWGIAPVLIWRAWGIRDTMGWRTQTIGACVSGLHATPMFLIASYCPAFYPINAYFHPSQWIHLNTMFIEIFTIFIPAYQVVKTWYDRRRVASSNDRWETCSQATIVRVLNPSAKGSNIELAEKDQVFGYINSNTSDRLLTISALNRVLNEHPVPLQEFSAYHDFSGENIAFLTQVASWKESWANTTELGEEQRIDMYNTALHIYIDFVSPRDAEFPLNLSSTHLKALESIFETPARLICGEARTDPAVPFTFDTPPQSRGSDGSEATLHARFTGEIPEQFGREVFDEVVRHVKDLVLTNTWPKFVREMQNRRGSVETFRSVESDDSGASKGSGIGRFVRGLV